MTKYYVLVSYDVDSFHSEIKEACISIHFKDETQKFLFPSTTLTCCITKGTVDEALSAVQEIFLGKIDEIARLKKKNITVTKLLVAVYQKGLVHDTIICPRK
mgnify:CR=1 FL=1